MSRPLIVRPEAAQEMTEARDWYEGRRIGLGGEFLTAVETIFDRIRESPEMYAATYKSVRRAGLGRFPFVVYYRLCDDRIEVIAVQHGSRNPRRWRTRA